MQLRRTEVHVPVALRHIQLCKYFDTQSHSRWQCVINLNCLSLYRDEIVSLVGFLYFEHETRLSIVGSLCIMSSPVFSFVFIPGPCWCNMLHDVYALHAKIFLDTKSWALTWPGCLAWSLASHPSTDFLCVELLSHVSRHKSAKRTSIRHCHSFRRSDNDDVVSRFDSVL